MFTGIIESLATVVSLVHPKEKGDPLLYALDFPHTGLKEGASVSVEGVCQTVTSLESGYVWFQAIPETLRCTTLGGLSLGRKLNVERSVRLGEELGGHLLSGHVSTTATLLRKEGECLTFSVAHPWEKYLFPKGYIALDGISLTLVTVEKALFTVHLIPETIHRTMLASKEIGDEVHVEIDSITQITVDTVERLLLKRRTLCSN